MASKSWSGLLGSAARAAVSLLSASRERGSRTSASAPRTPRPTPRTAPTPGPTTGAPSGRRTRTTPGSGSGAKPGSGSGAKPGAQPGAGSGAKPGTTSGPRPGSGRGTEPAARGRYPGDYTGPLAPEYCPALDGDADPGEIVWTWVPYEEDHTQGKDRPVLVVGRDGAWLLALMLTSKDHSRDTRPPGDGGPRWMDIGTGPWDARGRESEVRLDRVLRIDPDQVRREGAIMDERTFRLITAQIR